MSRSGEIGTATCEPQPGRVPVPSTPCRRRRSPARTRPSWPLRPRTSRRLALIADHRRRRCRTRPIGESNVPVEATAAPPTTRAAKPASTKVRGRIVVRIVLLIWSPWVSGVSGVPTPVGRLSAGRLVPLRSRDGSGGAVRQADSQTGIGKISGSGAHGLDRRDLLVLVHGRERLGRSQRLGEHPLVAGGAERVHALDGEREPHPARHMTDGSSYGSYQVVAERSPTSPIGRPSAHGRAATALIAITPTSRAARTARGAPRRRGGSRRRPTSGRSRGTSPCRGRSAGGPRRVRPAR